MFLFSLIVTRRVPGAWWGTNTRVFEWAVFLEDFINPAKFAAVVLGWRLDANPDLFQLWHSSEIGFSKLNFAQYENPVADRLLERIRREYDRDELTWLTHQLHQTIAEDQPYTFLFAPRSTLILDRKLVTYQDGGTSPVRPSRSGEPWFFMTHWGKASEPLLSTGG